MITKVGMENKFESSGDRNRQERAIQFYCNIHNYLVDPLLKYKFEMTTKDDNESVDAHIYLDESKSPVACIEVKGVKGEYKSREKLPISVRKLQHLQQHQIISHRQMPSEITIKTIVIWALDDGIAYVDLNDIVGTMKYFTMKNPRDTGFWDAEFVVNMDTSNENIKIKYFKFFAE